MKQLLSIIGLALAGFSSCVSDNKVDLVEDDKSSSIKTEDGIVKIEEPENPNTEKISKDSIKPISRDQLIGLKGYKKDSLQMRIKFQEEVNKMNAAFKNSDFKTYAKFVLPGLVKKQKGMANVVANLEKDNKKNPLNFTRIVSGPIIDVADVIDQKGKSSGWYCILPHSSSINQNGKEMRADGYLVGYSPDMKECYFVDITRSPDEKVFQLLPDLKFIYERIPRK